MFGTDVAARRRRAAQREGSQRFHYHMAQHGKQAVRNDVETFARTLNPFTGEKKQNISIRKRPLKEGNQRARHVLRDGARPEGSRRFH